jgi:hypothetical protein
MLPPILAGAFHVHFIIEFKQLNNASPFKLWNQPPKELFFIAGVGIIHCE